MPPEFKDPLWPEPPPDLWRGGRPLAPWKPPVRKVAPPAPPEPGTKENETYLINPDLGPIIPPKGDSQTGQPLGPAFAQMPRDMQRSTVGATYDDMLRQLGKGTVAETAQGLKGSVMDTPEYAAIRQALTGGGPIGAGILRPVNGAVFSATENAAQRLLPKKLLDALKNDKRPGGEYTLDTVADFHPGERGYTEYATNSRTGQQHGPIDIRLNPKMVKGHPETGIHEANHAFSYRRSGEGSPANTGGFDVLPDVVKEGYLHLAEQDLRHAGVYTRADAAAHRLGLAPRYNSLR